FVRCLGDIELDAVVAGSRRRVDVGDTRNRGNVGAEAGGARNGHRLQRGQAGRTGQRQGVRAIESHSLHAASHNVGDRGVSTRRVNLQGRVLAIHVRDGVRAAQLVGGD